MAPSSRDASSFLNSTSGLLSVLDLNQEHKQDMEEMDVDQIVYVPDTPDRITARHIRGVECVEEESKLPVASHSGNHQLLDEGALNRPRGRTRPVTENGHSRRLHFHAPENISSLDKAERHISFNVSSSENSFAPRTALFRGMRADTASKHDTKHSIGAQRLDKGKALCTKFPIKSSTCQENSAALDMKQNGLMQISEKAFSRGASEDIVTEEIRRGPIATNGHSSLHCIANSPMIPGNICKGKEKKDDTCNGAGFGRDCGRVIDLSSGSQPRPGKKRLVRNGCISPHNIAMSLSSEHNNIGSIDVECTGTTNVGSSCPPREIGVGNSIAEDNKCNEVKGKHPCYPCSPREHDARTKHSSGRSSILHGKDVNGSVALGSNEGLDGWVSTRNRLKNSSSGETCSHSRRNDGDGCYQQHEIKRNNRIANNNRTVSNNRTASNNRTDCLNLEVQDALLSGQASSNLVSESDQVDVRHQVADKFIKRQKNRSSTVSDHGECSTSRFSESEILFLDSPGIPLNSGSTNNQIRRRRGNLDPVIEIDESSPEVGRHHSLGCIGNDNSDVRAMQVEADEILARELQEQLYQEMPAVEAGEIDEHMAWALQQQEGTQHASSSGIHHMLHPRGSSISPVYRQSRSRSSQNPPRRRGTQTRVPPSSRMTQLRRRFPGQPRTLLSRERNLQFPLDMDLDMRIDMLEALEATFGDFSDLAGHGLQLQRDFNENDYEMLLALDENNHQHVGASVNQINNLPESTIQTDNFEEVCAVCLETPARGDTIRHLPCFHKFHKDCIDPWLTRKRSCPVCKSSIT